MGYTRYARTVDGKKQVLFTKDAAPFPTSQGTGWTQTHTGMDKPNVIGGTKSVQQMIDEVEKQGYSFDSQ